MDKENKQIADEILLKVSKEIAVKFIEVGRLTPATFETTPAKTAPRAHRLVNKK